MTFSQILALLFQAFVLYETDQAVLEAGGTASSPALQVGSLQDKPVYGWISLSETKPAPPI